jgi:hypothetical protein
MKASEESQWNESIKGQKREARDEQDNSPGACGWRI